MAKDTENSNQLNLTVVALVALVAIVGLVALVMNVASVKTVQLATGSKLANAADKTSPQNIAGNADYKIGTRPVPQPIGPPIRINTSLNSSTYHGNLVLNGAVYRLTLDMNMKTLTIVDPTTGGVSVVALSSPSPTTYYQGNWIQNGQTITVSVDMTTMTITFTFPGTRSTAAMTPA